MTDIRATRPLIACPMLEFYTHAAVLEGAAWKIVAKSLKKIWWVRFYSVFSLSKTNA